MPPSPRRPDFLRRIIWPVLIAALIFVASSRSRVAGLLGVPNDDKLAHFAVYGLLATLACRLGTGRAAAVWALVATSVYGASDEWHQSFVPGRYSSFGDWVMDTLGAALAIALYSRWPRYRAWLESPVWRRRPADH